MDFSFEVIQNLRTFFSKIIDQNTPEDLNKIPEGFNNNIIWNIAHVVVTQQLLMYKLSGVAVKISEDMINKYRKDTKPEGDLSQDEITQIKQLLLSTHKKAKTDYKQGLFKNFNTYTVSTTGNTLTHIDEALQFCLIHESMHYGYVLALLKVLKTK